MRAPATIAALVAKGMAHAIEVGECLEWQGKMGNSKTIPVVKSREGKTYSAEYSVPREVWTAAHGSVPDGKLVYRKCCNNACVLLGHLAAGTRADWIANRKKNGLTKHSAATVAAMTQAARSRVNTVNSMEKAREVRSLLGEFTHEQIAERTGVSQAMVTDIARYLAWKDASNPFAGLMA